MSPKGGKVHHSITIWLNGLKWSCSCGMHGNALHERFTAAWASEHVVIAGHTKSISRAADRQ